MLVKKLLFLPFIFLFACCKLPDNVKPPDKNLQELREVTLPALKSISDYQVGWSKAHTGIILWVNNQGESQSKMELKRFVNEEFPKMKSVLEEMETAGTLIPADSIPQLCVRMEALVRAYQEIMNDLSTFESYQNAMIIFQAEVLVMESDSDCEKDYRYIEDRLHRLHEKLHLDASLRLEKSLH